MLAARERLYGADKGPDGMHQTRHGAVLMVSGDGVMQCLPQPLDNIDPGAIGRLEHKLEFRIASEPALRDPAFMDGVVIDDEHDTSGTSVSTFELVEQMDEQQGVLSLMLDAYDVPGLCVLIADNYAMVLC